MLDGALTARVVGTCQKDTDPLAQHLGSAPDTGRALYIFRARCWASCHHVGTRSKRRGDHTGVTHLATYGHAFLQKRTGTGRIALPKRHFSQQAEHPRDIKRVILFTTDRKALLKPLLGLSVPLLRQR